MDLERAEFFYKKIFNATFFNMKDYPYEARGITLNETPESMEGALVKHPSRKPSHVQGTILFFEVDDVDDVVDHVPQEHIPVWREPFPIGHSPEREPCMARRTFLLDISEAADKVVYLLCSGFSARSAIFSTHARREQ
jgi:predicted enzyme related to lactoylglutathione lyase